MKFFTYGRAYTDRPCILIDGYFFRGEGGGKLTEFFLAPHLQWSLDIDKAFVYEFRFLTNNFKKSFSLAEFKIPLNFFIIFNSLINVRHIIILMRFAQSFDIFF